MKQEHKSKAKVFAWFLSALLLFGSVLPSAQLYASGDTVILRKAGTKSYEMTLHYPEGGELDYGASGVTTMERTDTGGAVFCTEPGMEAALNGEAYKMSPLGDNQSVTLSGYSDIIPGGAQVADDITMTPAQQKHLALYVYHGWDTSPTKTDDERMAVQCYVWEYLWHLRVEFQDHAEGQKIRAIQERIAEKVRNHGVKPVFSGSGYNAGTHTLTIKAGQSVTLTDSANAIAKAKLMKNDAKIKASISGNKLTITADSSSQNGTVVFYKFPDVNPNASSLLMTFENKQRVMEFHTKDPQNFILNLNVIRSGALEFTKTGADGQPLDGAAFRLLNASGRAVALKETAAGVYSAGEGAAQTSFTTHNGKAVIHDLADGRYTIEETAAPAGYVKAAASVAATVRAGETTRAALSNQKQTFRVTVTKKGANQELLSGAVFQLKNPNGQLMETLTTGPNGQAVSRTFPLDFPGRAYSVTEITPPAAWTIDFYK